MPESNAQDGFGSLASGDPPLDVLLIDGPLIAINKPAGIPTQAPPIVRCSATTLVKSYLRQSRGKTGNVYLGVPHRLDRLTSGVLIMATNSKAATRMSAEFAERRVVKRYWAIVEGSPPEEERWEDFLAKATSSPVASIVDHNVSNAQHAVANARLLGRCSLGAVIEVVPETGRFHQIRVQTASRGRPIVGDVAYGAVTKFPQWNRPSWWDSHAGPPIALHCRSMEIRHPIRYDQVAVMASLPWFWPAEMKDTQF